MFTNKLQLNEDKTEIVLVASKPVLSSSSLPQHVSLNGAEIQVSSVVRNLGVHLDESLSFQQQVSSI